MERWLVLVAASAWVLAVGGLRYVTGPDYAFSALFLPAIFLVTWLGGVWQGVFVAALGALAWLAVDLSQLESFAHPLVPLVNESLRLAVFLGVVWMVARLRAALQLAHSLPSHDPLTGTLTRRALIDRSGPLLRLCRRTARPVALAFLDADGFKAVNDTRGHHAGDAILETTGEVLRRVVRRSDLVARWGGDEFVVFLAGADEAVAKALGQRLIAELERAMSRHGGEVTYSVGLACFAEAPDDVDAMVRVADSLMYEAKNEPGFCLRVAARPQAPLAREPGAS